MSYSLKIQCWFIIKKYMKGYFMITFHLSSFPLRLYFLVISVLSLDIRHNTIIHLPTLRSRRHFTKYMLSANNLVYVNTSLSITRSSVPHDRQNKIWWSARSRVLLVVSKYFVNSQVLARMSIGVFCAALILGYYANMFVDKHMWTMHISIWSSQHQV